MVSLTKPCAIAAPYDCQVPDYDESIIQRAVQALASKQLGEYAHRQRLEALAAGGFSSRQEALQVEVAGSCLYPSIACNAISCSSSTPLAPAHSAVLSVTLKFTHSLLPLPPAAVRQLRGESGGAAAPEQGVGAPPDLSFGQEEPADVEAAYVGALEELSVSSMHSNIWIWCAVPTWLGMC